MKKIINRPETVVTEMCKGLVLTNPDLEFVKKYKVIRKKNLDKNIAEMFLHHHLRFRCIRQLRKLQVIRVHF